METFREHLRDRPFTLALGAGFFGFYAHAGFMSALEEADVRPARVTGASAGALVGGLFAAGLDSVRMRDELSVLRREHFWDPGFGFGLLRGKLFRERLEGILPNRRMSALGVPVALSVWDIRGRTTRVRTEGDLAEAICASCALPFLFQPVRIDRRWFLDGGIADRPAHASIQPEERVVHHHLYSPDECAPWRDKSVTLVMEGLPRLGPFRLEQGMTAFDEAYRRTRAALDSPVRAMIDA